MRAVALLALLAGCATSGQPWASSREHETGEWRAQVTAKYECYGTGWDDPPCRPYRRNEDAPYGYVRLLFTYDYACPVSAEDMVMAKVSEAYVCKWRAPR